MQQQHLQCKHSKIPNLTLFTTKKHLSETGNNQLHSKLSTLATDYDCLKKVSGTEQK